MWRVVRISRPGLPGGAGRPLAVRAPRVCVGADAHKKIRGKTPKGRASFGLPTFLSEWCGCGAARGAAPISGGAARVAARRCQRGSPEWLRGCPAATPRHSLDAA